MEEYIDIKNKFGKTEKAKVILRYHDEKNDKYYLVYELNNTYYAAKYEDKIGTCLMDNNLTKEELASLETILNSISKE